MQHCFGIYLIKNQLDAQGWLEMQIRLVWFTDISDSFFSPAQSWSFHSLSWGDFTAKTLSELLTSEDFGAKEKLCRHVMHKRKRRANENSTKKKNVLQDIYQLKCFNKQKQTKMGPGNKKKERIGCQEETIFTTPPGCVTQVTEHSDICYLLC